MPMILVVLLDNRYQYITGSMFAFMVFSALLKKPNATKEQITTGRIIAAQKASVFLDL